MNEPLLLPAHASVVEMIKANEDTISEAIGAFIVGFVLGVVIVSTAVLLNLYFLIGRIVQ